MEWLLALLTSLSADPAHIPVWKGKADAASVLAMSSLVRSVAEEEGAEEDVPPLDEELIEVPVEEPVCVDCNQRR